MRSPLSRGWYRRHCDHPTTPFAALTAPRRPRMMKGVRIGVDVGSVRVGVAASDPDGILATPVATLPRDTALDDLVALVAERDAVEVVVGHPRHLSGAVGAAARDAEEFAAALRERVDVPVILHDERLTTVSATRTLADRGVRGTKQRAVVDQAAAVAILQSVLDAPAPHDRASRARGGPQR